MLLNIATWPLAPIFAITRFGVSWPGSVLRDDALGRPSPAGHTVMNDAVVACVDVTFMATAPPAPAGIPAQPVTWTLIASPGEAHR